MNGYSVCSEFPFLLLWVPIHLELLSSGKEHFFRRDLDIPIKFSKKPMKHIQLFFNNLITTHKFLTGC